MTDWLLPALAGFGAGILSAWGVGGGTLLLLLMTLFLGVDQTQAQGINLLYFLPTAGMSLLEHRKNGYLDREVMAEAQRIRTDYKIDGHTTKSVLRAASNRTLPNEWAMRPKKGFPVPIRNWLREDRYYGIVKDAFTSDAAAEYFDTDALCSLLDAHKNGSVNNGRKIWTAFTFLTWHRRFFGE